MTAWLRWLPLVLLVACTSDSEKRSSGGSEPRGVGDEIIVAGVPYPIGAPVVTFRDAGGYNAYLQRCWFNPDRILPTRPSSGCNEPMRFGSRRLKGLDALVADRVRKRGHYDLRDLQERVDQFVLHYDVCGCSQLCFKVLHDVRGLSVHFMLDLDGTLYQTMDLAERGRHATIANDRSIGVEIAQIGAYPKLDTLQMWYRKDPDGRLRKVLPKRLGNGGLRVQDYIPRPAHDDLVEGRINGRHLHQHAFTAPQYETLARLCAALHRAFPKIALRAPRAPDGSVAEGKLDAPDFQAFQGILGHYHVQKNKADPGPATHWNWLLNRARTLPPPHRLEREAVLDAEGPKAL